MGIVCEELTEEFAGSTVDRELMLAAGWFQQTGKKRRKGPPAQEGVWIKQIEPAHHCSHYNLELFVLLHLRSDDVLGEVEEAVFMVLETRTYDDMGVGFFDPDRETARQEIEAIIRCRSSKRGSLLN